ncbi:MAG: hypothetical protein M1838_004166 [Thelocarpon superellum]|nr:MAG: hypothetical protein M1838_004166 [Thelocarpon superellum]
MEGMTPGCADTSIATTGTSTISYDLSGTAADVVRRDDRQYQIDPFWYFGRPELQPVQASIVTRGGENSYGCYVEGNEFIYEDPGQAMGYTVPAQTDILVREATRLSPALLLLMQGHNGTLNASTLSIKGTSYPAITDRSLNLTVFIDPQTFLPCIVRANEDHHIYGPSTNDLVLYNYTAVGGVQFPQRIKIMYNEASLLLDMITSPPQVNPSFPNGFFDGPPMPAQGPNEPVSSSTEYGSAEVFEFSMNLLWAGGYAGNLSRLTVTKPVPDLPLSLLTFDDAPDYTTLVGDFSDGVMVVDSPPHQSLLVIQWVQENIGKPITHLLVTHHHHDHNYGAADFVKVGATLVVPHEYTYYWASIPGVQFATVT